MEIILWKILSAATVHINMNKIITILWNFYIIISAIQKVKLLQNLLIKQCCYLCCCLLLLALLTEWQILEFLECIKQQLFLSSYFSSTTFSLVFLNYDEIHWHRLRINLNLHFILSALSSISDKLSLLVISFLIPTLSSDSNILTSEFALCNLSTFDKSLYWRARSLAVFLV